MSDPREEALLNARLDGALTPEEARRLEMALEQRAETRRRAAQLETLVRALDEVEPSEPRVAHRDGLQWMPDFVVGEMERVLDPPRGVYVRLGGIGEGAGFGVGPAFRYNATRFDFKTSAAASMMKYFIAEASLRFPGTIGHN